MSFLDIAVGTLGGVAEGIREGRDAKVANETAIAERDKARAQAQYAGPAAQAGINLANAQGRQANQTGNLRQQQSLGLADARRKAQEEALDAKTLINVKDTMHFNDEQIKAYQSIGVPINDDGSIAKGEFKTATDKLQKDQPGLLSGIAAQGYATELPNNQRINKQIDAEITKIIESRAKKGLPPITEDEIEGDQSLQSPVLINLIRQDEVSDTLLNSQNQMAAMLSVDSDTKIAKLAKLKAEAGVNQSQQAIEQQVDNALNELDSGNSNPNATSQTTQGAITQVPVGSTSGVDKLEEKRNRLVQEMAILSKSQTAGNKRRFDMAKDSLTALDKRIEKLRPGAGISPAIQTKILENNIAIELVNDIDTAFQVMDVDGNPTGKVHEEWVGPVQGSSSPWVPGSSAFRSRFSGGLAKDEALFRANVQRFRSAALSDLIGASQTAGELRNLIGGLPDATLHASEFNAAVLATKKNLQIKAKTLSSGVFNTQLRSDEATQIVSEYIENIKDLDSEAKEFMLSDAKKSIKRSLGGGNKKFSKQDQLDKAMGGS